MKISKNVIILLILAGILVVLRMPFIDEPFERDEGGYAYMGQCILEGEMMYRDIWETMPPGLPYIYAFVFKAYGISHYSIRIFSIFWGIIGLVLIILLSEILYGRRTAFFAGLFYAVFSSGPLVQGCSSNTEPYMNVFLIFSVYLLALFSRKGKYVFMFLSGMAAGAAVLVKQSALAGILGVYLYIFLTGGGRIKKDIKRSNVLYSILLFSAGIGLIWVPFFAMITKYRIWDEFVYAFCLWNLGHGQSIFRIDLFYVMYKSFMYIARENSILWVLAVSSLIYFIFDRKTKQNMLIVIWAVFSFFGVCLGGLFYPHYYIQMIPALSILSGFCMNNMLSGINKKEYWAKMNNIIAILALVVLSVIIVNYEYKYYFIYSPDQVSAAKYGSNIFPFTRDLGKFIGDETDENDTVYVWGMEPQIYFYSGRRCPVRFIHNYSIIGDDEFAKEGRREVMKAITKKKPSIIVPGMSFEYFPELGSYVEERYNKIGYKGFSIYKINE